MNRRKKSVAKNTAKTGKRVVNQIEQKQQKAASDTTNQSNKDREERRRNRNALAITIIGGLVVIFIGFVCGNIYRAYQARKDKKTFLSEISIGQSKNYIETRLDEPVVYAELPNYDADHEVSEGGYSNAGYKLDHCVVLCLYKDDSLAAYVVVVDKAGVYAVPTNSSLSNTVGGKFLLDFTYEDAGDFNTNVQSFEDVNHEPWIYGYNTRGNAANAYAEIRSGALVNNCNGSIIGSYQYYPSKGADTELYDMYNYGNIIMSYQKKNGLLGNDEDALDNLRFMYEFLQEKRKERRPNLFGIISFELVYKFDFVQDIVQNDSRADILFGDWH